jgi:hypothetical protein
MKWNRRMGEMSDLVFTLLLGVCFLRGELEAPLKGSEMGRKGVDRGMSIWTLRAACQVTLARVGETHLCTFRPVKNFLGVVDRGDLAVPKLSAQIRKFDALTLITALARRRPPETTSSDVSEAPLPRPRAADASPLHSTTTISST